MRNHSPVIPPFARAGRTEYARLSGELLSRRYHDETVGRLFSLPKDVVPKALTDAAVDACQEVLWAMPDPAIVDLVQARVCVEDCEAWVRRSKGER